MIVNGCRILIVVGLAVMVTGLVVAKPRKSQRLATGPWGGPGIRLNVQAASASVEYACATGTIVGPLTIDSKGRFSWRGTFDRQGPGPIRIDEPSPSSAAIYSGTIKGDTMTLILRLAGDQNPIDTFTLKRGAGGRVFRCK